MRRRAAPQARIQARSLNPVIITTGGPKNCGEAIGEYTAQVGTAALHFGAVIARNRPRQFCGCRNPKWRPRQSKEPATAADLG
ncbi:hypothetical protein NDU88_008421 [Pleurodeles waltl]|uniref:Uncharacterized protein n=1 Tax=Pleurodeles waltl TaxID=8319 RepID=A0AAV7RVB0_PLEWA|nr:hypothetical protein NDU88_008421 [Pleurodeles waltl]